MGPVKAFILSGRFRVMVAILSFTSYMSSSVLVGMGWDPPGR